ncbi:MAG: MFS transporter TsgA [Pseudomonadota bacterium]
MRSEHLAEPSYSRGQRLRATVACFLAYFVMSGMLAPIGILLPPLAEHLDLAIEDVAPLFSWLTLGILAGSALSLVVFALRGPRSWLVIVYAAIAAALLALRSVDALWMLRSSLGVVGVACGIGLAAAASTITALYRDDQRASMLIITDSSFSIAGICVSSLAVYLVAADLHWSSVYVAVALMALAVVALSLSVPGAPQTRPGGSEVALRWPPSVWLCIVALFLYTLGQYSLLWWLPSHLETGLGATRDDAGRVVARFWTGMLGAQLFVAWWVLRVGARRLVLFSVSGAFLGTLPLWQIENLDLLPWLATLWGFANLGLLKVVIAFATLMPPVATPRLVAALLFGATSGTAVSPVVTAAVAGGFGPRSVLQFGSACYAMLALLVVLAWKLSARRRPS